ncbi:DNA repair protein rad16, partial [Xylographa carneopallida]|nr:DNA repair protein rad16 [Xylographa carneopallida]
MAKSKAAATASSNSKPRSKSNPKLILLQTDAKSPAVRRHRGRPSLPIKKSFEQDIEIMDSDHTSLNNDILSSVPNVPSPAGSKIFKAVAIPITNFRRASRQAPSHSPSAASSVLSSYCENSNDDDTPFTSAAVTPAEFCTYGRKTRLPTDRMVNSVSDNSRTRGISTPSSSGGKRKRKCRTDDEMAEQVMGDALLAQSLQEQEYAETNVQPNMPRKRGRKPKILDSEDEVDGSVEISSLVSDDPSSQGSSIQHDREKVKRVKTIGSTFLPSRAARDSARKSIAEKASMIIMDSDEEELSEMSVYDSNLDSELEYSDLDDDDVVDPNDLATAANITAAPQTLSNAPRRRRRHLAQTNSPEATGRSRRFPWLTSRADRERAKLERAHPEIKTLWTDLETVPKIQPQQAQQPESINRKLKSFQLEGLDWMCKQEQSQWKGGLLGDEMGMGKTIQAVSLIMSDYPAEQPTLVVVPPVALMQWQNEINEYTNGKLKILVHHNTDPKVKKLNMKELKSYDVIMISYSGIESIYRKESKGWKRDDGLVKENSRIHAIKYHRLILDEAHNIKSRTTSVAKACFALKAEYKWCLSGTPVQNRIGEFFSLLRFLEVKPFACYFCKSCKCAELHWSQDEQKKCTHCHHSGFQHVSIFNQEILNPITQGDDPDLRKAALGKLRLITDRIMLRRVKRDHTASMELPPKEVIIHNEFFGEIERDFSSSIMSNTTRQFDTYVSRGVMLNNYANIFGLIMQMRQVANHPDLILKKHAEGGQNVLVCSICDETAEEPIRSRCHHEFCRKCAKDYVRSFEGGLNGDPDCPRCHIALAIDFDQPDIEQDEEYVKKNSIINRIKMEEWTSSTKIEMLIYDLFKLRSKKQTHKSIVFSQFTSMLQLVEWRLRRAGFNTVMLDGSMTPAQRQNSIEYFMKNTDVEVFLVSLKAGGVALNLTEASRVFIIDPWWNPAAEWQSADRCHRIGQKRPCVITRLCIEDSVESRMVMLQEKKANMINGTINNDQVAMEKLTPEDMQFLFR